MYLHYSLVFSVTLAVNGGCAFLANKRHLNLWHQVLIPFGFCIRLFYFLIIIPYFSYGVGAAKPHSRRYFSIHDFKLFPEEDLHCQLYLFR